jgi:uncharacterized protein YbgA (DUF1722 family)
MVAVSTEHKENETQIINTILHNNGYTPQILPRKKRKQMNTTPDATRNGLRSHMSVKKPGLIQHYLRTPTYILLTKQKNTLQKHLQLKKHRP